MMDGKGPQTPHETSLRDLGKNSDNTVGLDTTKIP
jgi:hypothetical protein